jgi:hypothetical protein
MEDIDITSPEYSLGIPSVSEIISETLEKIVDIPIINEITIPDTDNDYTMYIYLGVVILCLLSFFAYKFYTVKQKRVTFQDKLDECYGGVCQRV